jgi:hypothetical protein
MAKKILSEDARVDAAMRLLSAHGGFSVSDISEITGASEAAVKRRVEDLAGRELLLPAKIKHPEHGKSAVMYRALPNALVKRRETVGDAREIRRRHMWTAMRTMPRVSIIDMAFNATTDEVTISLSMAFAYVNALEAAGLLMRAGRPGAASADRVYRLRPSANTGPKPPRSIDKTSVVDPNTGAVWQAGVRTTRRIAA